MEKDDDEREAYNNVAGGAGSSMLYNPFAGVVKSLWGTTTEDKTDSKSDRTGGPETEPPPSAHLGEKESSFDEQSEVILVDLESLPTAVVFGPKGRARRLGSREELRQLKDELAMRSTSSDTISTSARERDTDSDVEDDGHQRMLAWPSLRLFFTYLQFMQHAWLHSFLTAFSSSHAFSLYISVDY
jgi:hypothetical protein